MDAASSSSMTLHSSCNEIRQLSHSQTFYRHPATMPAEWMVAEPYTYSYTSDPAATPSGVQCRLATVAGTTAPAPLHDWTTCASPRSYAALPDASYVFSVRAAGVYQSCYVPSFRSKS